MDFVNGMKRELNYTTTENGAIAVKSTLSKVVDMFGAIGSLRNYYSFDIEKAKELFLEAYDESPEHAIKILFYARDCRGGMGERDALNKTLIELASNYNMGWIIENNLSNIIKYGSWKDIINIFIGLDDFKLDGLRKTIAKFIYNQVLEDYENIKNKKPISLLGKWLPTINSSRVKTKLKAKIIYSYLKQIDSEFNYRYYCTLTREYMNVTEKNICGKTFDKIEYSMVPSLCMTCNRDTFYKHDGSRFMDYIESLKNGNEKINASVLNPFDIVRAYKSLHKEDDEVLEQQWKALPNWIAKGYNILPVIDTSGSMDGTPMIVAMSLGIYLAERNVGMFKDYIIEFGSDTSLHKFDSNKSLRQRLLCYNGDWGTTNIQKVFETILSVAVNNKLKQEELPSHLIIISDMQFDALSCKTKKETLIENARKEFEDAGYVLPKLIYWNVRTADNFPEIAKDGICYVSGYSPAIMKAVLQGETFTPMQVVKNAIMTERYDSVVWKNK